MFAVLPEVSGRRPLLTAILARCAVAAHVAAARRSRNGSCSPYTKEALLLHVEGFQPLFPMEVALRLDVNVIDTLGVLARAADAL